MKKDSKKSAKTAITIGTVGEGIAAIGIGFGSI